MAKKTRKCNLCKIEDTLKEDMEFEMVGVKKPVPKYYHKKCFEIRMKEKAINEQERLEKDKLCEVIKEIYGIKSIPNTFFPHLQELRDGGGKREGYTFDVLAETFNYCSDTIEYWLSVKDFNDLTGALKYGLSIVSNKAFIIENRRKDQETQQRLIDKQEEKEAVEETEFKSNYKKKEKKELDLTDFLDD